MNPHIEAIKITNAFNEAKLKPKADVGIVQQMKGLAKELNDAPLADFPETWLRIKLDLKGICDSEK